MREYNRRPEVKAKARARAIERAANPDYVAKNKAAARRNFYQREYGITIGERDALLAAQGGACALCGLSTKFGGSSAQYGAHLDHCHETGRVRGVLCARCNTSLGKFGDDPARLRAAAAYLERSP